MGYNRAGERRKKRLKRHKKETMRLLAKDSAAQPAPAKAATSAK